MYKAIFYNDYNEQKDCMTFVAFDMDIDWEISKIMQENQYCYCLVFNPTMKIALVKTKRFIPMEI